MKKIVWLLWALLWCCLPRAGQRAIHKTRVLPNPSDCWNRKLTMITVRHSIAGLLSMSINRSSCCRAFPEWREGHALCVDREGNAFKGECARKRSMPTAVVCRLACTICTLPYAPTKTGAVPSAFGSCPMKISGSKVRSPERARGQIARSSLYNGNRFVREPCLQAFGRSRRQHFYRKTMKAFFEEMQATGRKKLDEGTYPL